MDSVGRALLALRLVDAPVPWLASDTAVYIGIVYSYFPFMVLPLYAALEKMDLSLEEAAADLGCPPWKSFWMITVPLSLPWGGGRLGSNFNEAGKTIGASRTANVPRP